MFKYAYSLGDGSTRIEEFVTLDDARDRAYQHWSANRQGQLSGWKFALINDANDIVQVDPDTFEAWRKANKRIVRV